MNSRYASGGKNRAHGLDGVGLARCGVALDPGGDLLFEQPGGQYQIQRLRQPFLADQAADPTSAATASRTRRNRANAGTVVDVRGCAVALVFEGIERRVSCGAYCGAAARRRVAVLLAGGAESSGGARCA